MAASLSCTSGVKVVAAEFGARPDFCFRADFKDRNDLATYSWNCYTTESLCKAAFKVAKKYGSLADVISLVGCKRV